jgi:RNA polymerase subunit RPABC4/transcription elongation factor Spt4
MGLKACVECGRKVSSKARRCPKCGRRNPTRIQDEPKRNWLLVPPSKRRHRKGRCRECGEAVRLGSNACPACGFSHPTDTPAPRWAAVATLGLLLALLVVTAWKLGLLDPSHRGIESGLGGAPSPIHAPDTLSDSM